ncbi:MAG: DUF2203 family protein [Chloroflexi bacterium]|nr:MAG: DUF2203 family protein [Chloroflexota bacterium]TMD68364.1 MAG: DUF2203 family protein [Chloroflexota bacterium]
MPTSIWSSSACRRWWRGCGRWLRSPPLEAPVAETFYSVEEANALVPKLRPLLQRIRDTQQALAEDKTVAAVREKASHNGGGLPGRHLSELTKTLERDLKQLQDWGIVLRDPSIGLIDFFHQRQGETVFLCWKLGEARVQWWHPVQTGIAGREPL